MTLPCQVGVHDRCAGHFRSHAYAARPWVLEACNCACHLPSHRRHP
jgi:hypothetical protein